RQRREQEARVRPFVGAEIDIRQVGRDDRGGKSVADPAQSPRSRAGAAKPEWRKEPEPEERRMGHRQPAWVSREVGADVGEPEEIVERPVSRTERRSVSRVLDIPEYEDSR